MTRSSWHYFWFILMVVACVVFVIFEFSPHAAPGTFTLPAHASVAQAEAVLVNQLASDLVSITAFLAAVATIFFGLAVVACEMAFRARRYLLLHGLPGSVVKRQPALKKELPLDL